jgi:hypothetical protein
MNYNLNSGFGKAVAGALHNMAATGGKLFVVAKSTAAGRQMLQDIFRGDPDGIVRYHATVDAAINACTANRGDVILIAPGHTETLGAASAITQDTAGITILGLGEGADRPTFTFSATAATWVVSGASSVIKNIIATPSIDSVVSPFVVSGADCDLDIEIRDASAAIECVRGVLTTAGADNFELNLKYRGFYAGNACVNAVRLVGGSHARINIDFDGKASTAVVEYHTTAVVDSKVTGYMYNSGTTDFTKSVIDTVTGSVWYAAFDDGAAGQYVNGGSGEALAAGDLSSMASALASILTDTGTTLPALIGTPSTDLATDIAGTETAVGTVLIIQKTLTSSDIVQAGVDVTGAVSGGALTLIGVEFACDGTGLAAGTNVILSNNNDYGENDIMEEAVANLGANKSVDLINASVGNVEGTRIEGGKKYTIKSTVADCTGAGEMLVTMTFRRMAAGATIAAA